MKKHEKGNVCASRFYNLLLLTTMIFNINSIKAQTPVLSNTGVFCFDNISQVYIPVSDNYGNLYYASATKSPVYLNRSDVGFSNDLSVSQLVFFKSNADHDLIWSKSIEDKFMGVKDYVPYKGGMTGVFATESKQTISIDSLPSLQNDEAFLIFGLNIDYMGNAQSLFPIMNQKEGTSKPTTMILKINYDKDTLVFTSTVKGSAWFGSNNVFIEQDSGREKLFIARFNSEGEFIDINYPFEATGCINRNLLIENEIAYLTFSYGDTLYPLGLPKVFPMINPDIGLSWDIGLAAYDLKNQQLLWLNVLKSSNNITYKHLISQHFGSDVGLLIGSQNNAVHLNETGMQVPLHADLFIRFNKADGLLKEKIIVEREVAAPLNSNFYRYENDTSILISVNEFGSFVRINGQQFNFTNVANQKKSVFFRNSTSTTGYLGEVSTVHTNYLSSELSLNTGGNHFVTVYSSSSANPINVFGTEITDCDINNRIRIVGELSQLITTSELTAPHTPLTINAYPNPFRSELEINIHSAFQESILVNIINLQGAICYSASIESNQSNLFNLSALSSGMYYVVAETSQGSVVSKIFKTE
jgi:hypothetical protein